MAANDIKAGEAYVELGSRMGAAFQKGLNKAQDKLKSWGTGLSALGGAITAPFVGAIKTFADYTDQIDKISARTGVGAKAVSELGYVAELSGQDIGSFEKAIRGMQRSLFDASRGLTTKTEALKMLGVEYESIRGLAPEKQFEIIGGAIGDMEDPSLKAGAAMELFGRAGSQLIPMFNLGAAGIKKYREEAGAMLGMSQEQAAIGAELVDTYTMIKRGMQGIAMEAAKPLVADMVGIREQAKGIIVGTREWVSENHALIITVAKAGALILGMGAAMLGLAAALKVVAIIFSPAGAFGLAIASLLFLADALGFVDLGLRDMVGSFRVGGSQIDSWLTAAWLHIFKGWEYVKGGILAGWEFLKGAISISIDFLKNKIDNFANATTRKWYQLSGDMAEIKVGLKSAFGMEVSEDDIAAARKARADANTVADAMNADTEARGKALASKVADTWAKTQSEAAGRMADMKKNIGNLDGAIEQVFVDDAAAAGKGTDKLGGKWASLMEKFKGVAGAAGDIGLEIDAINDKTKPGIYGGFSSEALSRAAYGAMARIGEGAAPPAVAMSASVTTTASGPAMAPIPPGASGGMNAGLLTVAQESRDVLRQIRDRIGIRNAGAAFS